MHLHVFTLLSAALLSPGLVPGTMAGRSCAHHDLTVETKNGIVHGTVNPATPAVREFLGIPFAKPPLGDLRFAPPQPAEPFGEINATVLPLSCMQFLTSNPGVWEDLVLEFNQGGLNTTKGLITEDCLYLSVFGPRGDWKDLPVLVWVYGGSFKTGGMNIPYQIPRRWVERTQDHIVVLFNYRINAFGFSNAAALEDGERNVGLMDQRLAVEWVRDNIADFGGDPARIGLWGQSAGAISVAYYSYRYPEDPIVSSLIMDSGSELLDLTTIDPTSSNFTFLASQFGCGGLQPAAELACMRKVDAFAIEDFLHSYQDAGTTPAITFTPAVDEKTVFSDYHARALAGQVAKIVSSHARND
jgi:carboxylesterase type B